jgi:hypothetical protein
MSEKETWEAFFLDLYGCEIEFLNPGFWEYFQNAYGSKG